MNNGFKLYPSNQKQLKIVQKDRYEKVGKIQNQDIKETINQVIIDPKTKK